MKGEIVFFRKRFFGGFNRRDVTMYIAELARERNEIRAALEKTREQLETFSGALDAKTREIEQLRNEIDELRNNKPSRVAVIKRR